MECAGHDAPRPPADQDDTVMKGRNLFWWPGYLANKKPKP
ncbi:hypothetical protein M2280_006203 [Prescottella agglutinans]|uniref:Uncharacterized protein n=1 Tax=Prescottella agglutinans TaxID=1644129 RepID=A0ABT6MLR0_9NOCA|nr:hypothetical protein [Prescottella agglutinans]